MSRTYQLDVALKPRVRLKLFAADATGFVVHVWAIDLVVSQVVIGFEVLVALMTVVMIVVMLLVPLHVFLGREVEVAGSKRTLHFAWIYDCRHNRREHFLEIL